MKRIYILLVTVAVSIAVSCDTEKSERDSLSNLILLESAKTYPVPEPCTAIPYEVPAPADAPLAVQGGQLKDALGRIVFLRGVNVAGDSKVPDFMPITGEEMLDPLPGWGFNTIRLLFTWEAFESTRCTYDVTYLDYYEQAVEWAEARGLYVLVDFHQDAYSRYSIGGCGEGFPEWAVTPEVRAAEPDNGESCSGWGVKMVLSLTHKKTWKDFHRDTYGARTRYLDMVEAVADRMSAHANVIGYELLNEPWGSDENLSAFFELVAAKIRGRHPNTILFVPPPAIVSSGMVDNTMEKPAFDNFVYSTHYYNGNVVLFGSWGGTSPAEPLNGMLGKAGTWGVPMVLSEFGGPATAGNIGGYIAAQYDWLDDNFVSGIQWCYTPGWTAEGKDGWNMEDFSIVDDTGALRANFTPRPWPRKLGGTPVSFDLNDDGLTLSWNNTVSGAATEVFLPVDYEDDKTLLWDLPGGAASSCIIGSQVLTCTVTGTGTAEVSLSR